MQTPNLLLGFNLLRGVGPLPQQGLVLLQPPILLVHHEYLYLLIDQIPYSRRRPLLQASNKLELRACGFCGGLIDAAVIDDDGWRRGRCRQPSFAVRQEQLETQLLLVVAPEVLDLRDVLVRQGFLYLDPVLPVQSHLLLEDLLLFLAPHGEVALEGLRERWLLVRNEDLQLLDRGLLCLSCLLVLARALGALPIGVVGGGRLVP